MYFFTGLIVLVLLALTIYGFVNADPRRLASQLRTGGGLAMLAAAGLLALTGRIAFAVPLAFVGISLLNANRFLQSRKPKSTGQASQVRSKWLEMQLDHDTGALSGHVRAGRFEGRDLDELEMGELMSLFGAFDDAESGQLLEAYLDRRSPGWREDVEGDPGAGQGASAGSDGPMSLQEAYQLLGLAPGATASEIRRAHKALMMKVHPDRGGSTYLAAKINEAKELLLREAGSR